MFDTVTPGNTETQRGRRSQRFLTAALLAPTPQVARSTRGSATAAIGKKETGR